MVKRHNHDNGKILTYNVAAKRRIWEIQRLLNIARTVLPEIPYPQTLDVVTSNPLLHMQINLNYVDISWKGSELKNYVKYICVY